MSNMLVLILWIQCFSIWNIIINADSTTEMSDDDRCKLKLPGHANVVSETPAILYNPCYIYCRFDEHVFTRNFVKDDNATCGTHQICISGSCQRLDVEHQETCKTAHPNMTLVARRSLVSCRINCYDVANKRGYLTMSKDGTECGLFGIPNWYCDSGTCRFSRTPPTTVGTTPSATTPSPTTPSLTTVTIHATLPITTPTIPPMTTPTTPHMTTPTIPFTIPR